MKDIKKTQMELCEMEKAIFEIEKIYILDMINNRLHKAKEKISESKTQD